MTSLASAIAGLGIKLNGQTCTPATFNSWLDKNGGFQGDLFVWGSIGKLGLSFVGFDSTGAQAAASFNAGKIVVINVHGGQHWVLVTGVSGSTFEVMDPGFNTNTYSFGNVVKAGVFSKPAGSSSSNSNTASSGSSPSKPSSTASSSSSSTSTSSPSKASGPMYGVDISIFSGAVSKSTMECLINQGKKFIVIEAWNGGYQLNNNLAANVANAWAAGFESVDIYGFFCSQCRGNSPASSAIGTLSSYLSQNKVKYGTLWLDVEQASGTWSSSSSNLDYITQAAQAAQKDGITVGVYTSIGSWEGVVGSLKSTYLAGLPLWYAHYNGNPQMTDPADYQFGGWTKSGIKQYAGTTTLCGLDTDLDYAPNGIASATNSTSNSPKPASNNKPAGNNNNNPSLIPQTQGGKPTQGGKSPQNTNPNQNQQPSQEENSQEEEASTETQEESTETQEESTETQEESTETSQEESTTETPQEESTTETPQEESTTETPQEESTTETPQESTETQSESSSEESQDNESDQESSQESSSDYENNDSESDSEGEYGFDALFLDDNQLNKIKKAISIMG